MSWGSSREGEDRTQPPGSKSWIRIYHLWNTFKSSKSLSVLEEVEFGDRVLQISEMLWQNLERLENIKNLKFQNNLNFRKTETRSRGIFKNVRQPHQVFDNKRYSCTSFEIDIILIAAALLRVRQRPVMSTVNIPNTKN